MGELALTFDDGPDPAGTPDVLAALRATGARATFFVLGERVAHHPDLVTAAVRAGHAVGVHGDEHVRHGGRDAGWSERDLGRALSRLARLGVHPTHWRLPWGEHNEWTQALADRHGLTVSGWTLDTHDWRGDDAERMLAATIDGFRDGAVVLAHDGIGPGARRSDATETARYVTLAAQAARRRDLRLTALR